ncbi:TIGR03016 family PEP-CTERM system-associated outer membrane protein [Massilia cavernae]|nr:TIGR03016 family PEP-CTERM system-associated outer membrane protein [Massilia cavernae]
MAKQRRAVRALAPLALLLATPAQADWKFTPTLDVRETYTDNSRLAPRAEARGDWYAEVTPGFSLSNHSRRFSFDSSYQLHYYYGLEDGRGPVDRVQSQLGAKLRSELAEGLLYFDASASISQQAISAFEPLPQGNFFNPNRAEVRSWSASPYLVHRFGTAATATLRYARDSVDTGTAGIGTSEGDTVSFSLASGPGFRDFGWNVQASEQRVTENFAPETTARNANIGLRYKLSRTLAATASVGYDDYDYQAIGGKSGGRAWSGGFSWTPSTRTQVDASVGRRFYGPSYYLSAVFRTRRSAWDLQYNDMVSTTRAQFVLPSAVSTADMLDRLFAATVPDPVARQRAVQAYMQATGLPPSLIDNVNYFSNRYFLQKELRASAAWRSVRTRLMLTAFSNRRTALSTLDADSQFLGPNQLTLNDATRQAGASAVWNYTLNSRTEANATINAIRAESESARLDADHRFATLSLVSRFGRKLTGTLELRRNVGPSVVSGAGYTENAVSAALNLRL